MNGKFLRVSESYDTIHNWIEGIECDKIVVYEHEADEEVSRVHCHMLILGQVRKDDALKTRYINLYKPEVKGNKLWSWKQAYDLDCLTYMAKGVLQPKYTKGFDTNELEEYRVKWVDPKTVNVKVENGKFVKEVKETDKKSKRYMLEQMRQLVSSTSTPREILRAIRKVLMANNEVIGQYKMMDYYDSIMMYDMKENWLIAMERKIVKKYEDNF